MRTRTKWLVGAPAAFGWLLGTLTVANWMVPSGQPIGFLETLGLLGAGAVAGVFVAAPFALAGALISLAVDYGERLSR
jgi:hypothetical protein